MLNVQIVHEECEDAQYDGGGNELSRAHQVESERGVEGWLLGDFGAGVAFEHDCFFLPFFLSF